MLLLAAQAWFSRALPRSLTGRTVRPHCWPRTAPADRRRRCRRDARVAEELSEQPNRGSLDERARAFARSARDFGSRQHDLSGYPQEGTRPALFVMIIRAEQHEHHAHTDMDATSHEQG